jgi:TRAP-type C4-dicarboxylate transport system substrate-binding protein
MKSTSLLLASTLALFASPALAQEETTLNNRTVHLYMNGKMMRTTVNDESHAMIMRRFKPMKPGTMVYYSDGQLYMAEDAQMENGRMMSQQLFGRSFGFSQ